MACVEPELRLAYPDCYPSWDEPLFMYVVYSHVSEQPCGLFPSLASAKAAADQYTATKGDFCSLYKLEPGKACAYTRSVWSNS